jgi:hypothetical protein
MQGRWRAYSIGFELREVFQAIQKAGVGYDIPALTAWILDRKCNDKDVSRFPPVIFPNSFRANERNISQIVPGKSPESMVKQWSIVARPGGMAGWCCRAQWVTKPPKVKSRMSETKSVTGEEYSPSSLKLKNSLDVPRPYELGKQNKRRRKASSGNM